MAKVFSDLEEENVLLKCLVCMKQLTDPRSLPCLHRYCCMCLSSLVTNSEDPAITCLSCKLVVHVPSNGLQDFPEDFVTSFILRKKLLNEQLSSKINIQFCKSCEKEKNAVAYCPKCDSFICDPCKELHLQPIAPYKDHKCIMVIDDESDRENLSQLATDSNPPRCITHSDQVLHISCITCDGSLLCPACAMLTHQNHKFEGVNDAAKRVATNLNKMQENVRKLYQKWDDYRKEVEEWKQNTSNEVTDITDRIKSSYEQKLLRLQKSCDDKKDEVKCRIQIAIKRLEEELQQGVQDADEEFVCKLSALKNSKSETLKDLGVVGENFQAFYVELEDQVKSLQERYKNSDITASISLRNISDWTAVKELPRVFRAFEGLHNKMEIGIPEMEAIKGTDRELDLIQSDDGACVGSFSRPGTPGKPKVISSNAEKITIEWSLPEVPNAGQDRRYMYTIDQRKVEGDEWTCIAKDCRELTHVIDGLEERQKYHFRVSAAEIIAGLYGSTSGESDVFPFPIVPTIPGKPKVIMFSKKDITIQWEKSASEVEGVQCCYKIEQKTEGENEWIDIAVNITKPRHAITGLTEGGKYRYRVSSNALNGAWYSSSSDESDVVPFPFLINSENASVLFGVKVMRSEDWCSKNEDGNGVGEITRLAEHNGSVYVKWYHNNKEGKSRYYMGESRKYELQLAET